MVQWTWHCDHTTTRIMLAIKAAHCNGKFSCRLDWPIPDWVGSSQEDTNGVCRDRQYYSIIGNTLYEDNGHSLHTISAAEKSPHIGIEWRVCELAVASLRKRRPTCRIDHQRWIRLHIHTHTCYIYIYIYIYTCVCVCVCVRVRAVPSINWSVTWDDLKYK